MSQDDFVKITIERCSVNGESVNDRSDQNNQV